MKFTATNVSMVNITCGLDTPTEYQHACHGIVANILLRNENSRLNIVCNGQEGCFEGIFIIDTMLSRDIMNTKSQINIECIGEDSCYEGSFTFIGINNVNISCEYAYACYHMALTSTTLNELPSGTLTANCISGYEVCKCLIVNGISMESIQVTCPYGDNENNHRFSCWGLQVYCPINPFGLITDDSQANTYYNINNIDQNTCFVDLGFNGDHAEIYAIFSIPQTRIINANPSGFSRIGCELDWFNYRYHTLNTTNWDDYCSENRHINRNIELIKNNSLSLVTPNSHSNTVSCSNTNDCVIYISPQLTPVKTINCPKGNNNICSIVWYVFIYGEIILDAILQKHNTVSINIHVKMLPLMPLIRIY